MRWLLDALRRWRFPGWALLFCCSCAGSLESARASRPLKASRSSGDRCATLDDRRTLFGGTGKTLALLGGGAGLGTIATDDPQLRTGLAIGAAASAALAAGAVYVSEQSGDAWARECSP